MTARGKLLQGSHLILTAGSQGQLSAEGVGACRTVAPLCRNICENRHCPAYCASHSISAISGTSWWSWCCRHPPPGEHPGIVSAPGAGEPRCHEAAVNSSLQNKSSCALLSAAAGITRGRLKDRRAVLLGTWRSPHLTAAVLDQFLGDAPLDPAAKLRAGAGLLFLTNGFRCCLSSGRTGNSRIPLTHVRRVSRTC